MDYPILATADEVRSYRDMTFPFFRPYLAALTPADPFLVVGAASGGRPVGLVVAQDMGDGLAWLRSVYVLPDHRKQGIATGLTRQVIAHLVARQFTRVVATYTTDTDSVAALDRVLDRTGWTPPRPRMALYRATAETARRVSAARWLRRGPLPEGFALFPWVELTADERRRIDEQTESGQIAASLSPFVDPETLEPHTSLGLRHRGEVVGWVVTHRADADFTRITSLYARPNLPANGMGLRLLAEALERFLGDVPSQRKGGCWGTSVDLPFAEFLRRRVLAECPEIRVSLTVIRSRDLVAS